MGFAEFSFPGATHNRYCHSLGAMHLAGVAFDNIFRGFPFTSSEVRWRLRQTVRLAALLHDVGHGPLSHTSEEVMPMVSALNLTHGRGAKNRRANHEDYTLKIVTDSPLASLLKKGFSDLQPQHIAQLIDRSWPSDDDFFIDHEVNLRPLLSQVVSSELDVDRMDYLARDSYYCGTSYGQVDSDWLISNLTFFREEKKINLALSRRALFTFDDFLISRYHMYLMVYFHHKAIIYDEMLLRFMKSEDCDFRLPSDLDDYVRFDDHTLNTLLSESKNPWAKLIVDRQPYRMLCESHDQKSDLVTQLESELKGEGIDCIRASSTGRLSKYYSENIRSEEPLFVIDKESLSDKKVSRIEDSTEIFKKYEGARKIDRLYVSREDYSRAEKMLVGGASRR